MHCWIQASPSDFSGTLPQPRRYSYLFLSLSLSLDVFYDFFDRVNDFSLHYKTVVTPLLLSENRSWLCLVDLLTRSFSPTSQFMIWVLNVDIKFVLSEKSYNVLN